jgi:hypothetical protein
MVFDQFGVQLPAAGPALELRSEPSLINLGPIDLTHLTEK